MKTILLTLTITFLLGFFNLLNAQDGWIFYSEGEDALHYYHKKSIVIDGNIVKVWRKSVLLYDDKLDYIIIRSFFKCGERMIFYAVNNIYYYKDGSSKDESLANNINYPEYNLIYSDIYPETHDEVLYYILCKY